MVTGAGCRVPRGLLYKLRDSVKRGGLGGVVVVRGEGLSRAVADSEAEGKGSAWKNTTISGIL